MATVSAQRHFVVIFIEIIIVQLPTLQCNTHILHVKGELDPVLGLVVGIHQSHHVEGVQTVHYGGTHLGVLTKDGRRVATF